jgi:predicted kinase
MPKITILQGLPASGKTTIAKEMVSKTRNTKRINKDDMRALFDNSKWTKNNEKFILKARDLLIEQALQDNFCLVIDDTNLHPKHIETIKEIAKKYKAQVEIKFIDTPIEECIKRDLQRLNSVGEKVIKDMYNNFLAPKSEVISYSLDLPDCYIFDIDGTLALKSPERGYFDWDKVDLDIPNTPVVKILNGLTNRKEHVFIFSGRDEICREKTKVWLMSKTDDQTDTIEDRLYMRPLGNQEDDRTIKEKIYQDNIKGRYNVLGIFDDRPKVCRMWRELGLPVFQVGDPDIEF